MCSEWLFGKEPFCLQDSKWMFSEVLEEVLSRVLLVELGGLQSTSASN